MWNSFIMSFSPVIFIIVRKRSPVNKKIFFCLNLTLTFFFYHSWYEITKIYRYNRIHSTFSVFFLEKFIKKKKENFTIKALLYHYYSRETGNEYKYLCPSLKPLFKKKKRFNLFYFIKQQTTNGVWVCVRGESIHNEISFCCCYVITLLENGRKEKIKFFQTLNKCFHSFIHSYKRRGIIIHPALNFLPQKKNRKSG